MECAVFIALRHLQTGHCKDMHVFAEGC
jgi:hypothetical protein